MAMGPAPKKIRAKARLAAARGTRIPGVGRTGEPIVHMYFPDGHHQVNADGERGSAREESREKQ